MNNKKYSLASITTRYVSTPNLINGFRQDTSYRIISSEFAEHLVEDWNWEQISISAIGRAFTSPLITSHMSN